MALTPIPGANIITTDKGFQVYSRLTQEQYNKSKGIQQQDQPVPKTVPNYIPEKPYYTNDEFQAQREEALRTGKFDYGAVRSSSYSPPATITTKSGATITRQPSQPIQTQSPEEHARQQALSEQRLAEDRQQVAELTKLRELYPSEIKSGSPQEASIRQKAEQLKQEAYQQGGYHQTETKGNPVAGNIYKTAIPPLNTSYNNHTTNEKPQSQNKELKSTVPTETKTLTVPAVHPINKITESENSLAKTNELRSKEGLPPLESVVQVNEVIYPKGNAVTESKPSLAKTDALRASLGLPPLEAVVPVKEITYTKQTVTTKEAPIKQVTSTQTTPTYKEDVLSLIARPILEMGASIGVPILEALKGKIAESPLQAYLEGKQNNPLTPVYTEGTQDKIEKPFGVSQEVENLTSGKYEPSQSAAALVGVVSSVAIPITAGASGLGKVPELETLANKLTGKTVSKITEKVVPAFKEKTLEVTKEQQGKTTVLTQGTEQQISLTELKVEKAIPFYEPTKQSIVKEKEPITGIKIEELKPVTTEKYEKITPTLPKGISETKITEKVGVIGSKTVNTKPSLEEVLNRYPPFGKIGRASCRERV